MLGLLAAFMVVGSVYAYQNAVTGSSQASDSLPTSVERLIPESGTSVLAQSEVGIDLATGYDAYLVIDGQVIDNEATAENPDGLRKVPDLQLVEYTPAEGRRVERLEGPQQCVDAFVWDQREGRADGHAGQLVLRGHLSTRRISSSAASRAESSVTPANTVRIPTARAPSMLPWWSSMNTASVGSTSSRSHASA